MTTWNIERDTLTDRYWGYRLNAPAITTRRELFDAEIVTTDGQPAPTTLKEMTRDDGVVCVAFRKRNGVVYLTAFSRKKPAKGLYHDGVQIDTAFAGAASYVDEMTGKPAATQIEHERLPNGLRLKNVRVPFMSSSYGLRPREPIALPVIRISPR